MSKSNRPLHDRSNSIRDIEYNALINLIEKEDGVVCIIFLSSGKIGLSVCFALYLLLLQRLVCKFR